MSEKRDQKLAELFESNAAELSGDEFVASIQRRIARQANVARLCKAMLVLALVWIGVFFSTQMDSALIEAQVCIEQALQQFVRDPLETTIGKVTVSLFVICFFVWRRVRRA